LPLALPPPPQPAPTIVQVKVITNTAHFMGTDVSIGLVRAVD
jgi:hypothetical protein